MLGHFALGNLLRVIFLSSTKLAGRQIAHEVAKGHLAHALDVAEVADVLSAVIKHIIIRMLK